MDAGAAADYAAPMAAAKKPLIKNRELRRLAHEARMLFTRLDERTLARLRRRRLVFTLTNGRSGSMVLYSLFDLIENVEAAHEPDPRLDFHRPRASRDAAYARRVIDRLKLPAISEGNAPVYVETNNLIVKAYADALEAAADKYELDLAYIVLTRPARDIARSMLRLNTIPGRSRIAKYFYNDPSEPCLLQPTDPDALTDYQLCYWQTLETEARQAACGVRAEAAGRRVARVALADLNAPGGFENLIDALDLPMTDEDRSRVAAFRGRTVNEKSWAGPAAARTSDAELDAAEAAVRREVGLAA
ncbi:MAG: hypothetical protein AAFR11_13300 [Pseudomonadota bacterium]